MAFRTFVLFVCVASLSAVARGSLAGIKGKLSSLAEPTTVNGRKIVSPTASLRLLEDIGAHVNKEMEYRKKERVTMEARCMKKRNFFETEMSTFSKTIHDNQVKLQSLMPRVHKIEAERDESRQKLVALEDRIKSITEAIAVSKNELADASILRTEDMKHFNGRTKALRDSRQVVELIMNSVKRATALKKGPKAIMKATEQLDQELGRICDPLSPAVDSTYEICLKHKKKASNSSTAASLLELSDVDPSVEEHVRPAAKIIAQLADMHESLDKAHKTEETQEGKNHQSHKGLVEKLQETLNTKRSKLHKLQKEKLAISKKAKANRETLEGMNRLSDDLNFGMDHAREGIGKARHHLEQHNAMCESLEENFAGFKRQLGVVIEEINTIRKVIQTRVQQAEKVIKKVLKDVAE